MISPSSVVAICPAPRWDIVYPLQRPHWSAVSCSRCISSYSSARCCRLCRKVVETPSLGWHRALDARTVGETKVPATAMRALVNVPRARPAAEPDAAALDPCAATREQSGHDSKMPTTKRSLQAELDLASSLSPCKSYENDVSVLHSRTEARAAAHDSQMTTFSGISHGKQWSSVGTTRTCTKT